jgi:hypothetical protein
MRPPVDEQRIRDLARALGRVARDSVRIYLTGGSTAVLEGWRDTTIDGYQAVTGGQIVRSSSANSASKWRSAATSLYIAVSAIVYPWAAPL